MIATFTIPGRVVPKIRWGRERWTTRTTRYKASCDRIRDFAADAIPSPWPIRQPVRIGVAVFLSPVKSGANKGGLPGNAGDWEGSFGAVADALQKPAAKGLRPFLAGDDPRYLRGPCDVAIPPEHDGATGYMLPSGVYLDDGRGERVVVTIQGVG